MLFPRGKMSGEPTLRSSGGDLDERLAQFGVEVGQEAVQVGSDADGCLHRKNALGGRIDVDKPEIFDVATRVADAFEQRETIRHLLKNHLIAFLDGVRLKKFVQNLPGCAVGGAGGVES